MANYFIIDGGQQKGPCSVDALRAFLLTGETLVWTDGWADWRPIKNVPELQALLPQQQPAAQVYVQPQQPQQPQPQQVYVQPQQPVVQQPVYQQPVYQQPAAQQPAGVFREERRPMPATQYSEGVIITIISSLCVLTWIFAGWIIFFLLNFTFLTCFALPCGIIAMQQGKSVSTFYMARQYNEALRKSKSANRWAKVGWVFIILSLLLTGLTYLIVLLFFGGTLAAMTDGF